MFEELLKNTRKMLQPEAILDKVAMMTNFEDIEITILLARSGKEAQDIVEALKDEIEKLPKYMRVLRLGPRVYVHITLYPSWNSW
jgi:hypothetical protein